MKMKRPDTGARSKDRSSPDFDAPDTARYLECITVLLLSSVVRLN